jgi:uroporphyrinogen decarboxylase
MLCPEQIRNFTLATGRAERELADHFAFPFRGVQGLRRVTADKKEFLRYYPQGLKEGTDIDGWGVAREPGSGPEAQHFFHMRHPLAGDITMDDLAAWPFPVACGGNEEDMRAQAQDIQGGGLAACGHMSCTVWETSWYMRGMEDLMVDMIDGDERAAYLFDVVTDISLGRATSFARAGVDVLCTGDDIGTQRSVMMSPALYREHLKPRLAKVIARAREIKPDILIQYHSCGFIEPYIEDLIEVGVDILNPVQPECMDFKKLHSLYGSVLSFDGTLGTQTTMPFGTPDDVRRVVFENLETAGDKGGLTVSPTHLLEPEVPWENVLAYVKACGDFK